MYISTLIRLFTLTLVLCLLTEQWTVIFPFILTSSFLPCFVSCNLPLCLFLPSVLLTDPLTTLLTNEPTEQSQPTIKHKQSSHQPTNQPTDLTTTCCCKFYLYFMQAIYSQTNQTTYLTSKCRINQPTYLPTNQPIKPSYHLSSQSRYLQRTNLCILLLKLQGFATANHCLLQFVVLQKQTIKRPPLHELEQNKKPRAL